MNYIYDIYLNFNKKLYDFFDWNKNDEIIHIKKIPIVKINSDDFKKIMCYNIIIDNDFLVKIFDKTESWSVNKDMYYCSLFTDGNSVIAIRFDKEGNSIQKSTLYIDEELEIIDIVNRLNESKINFKVKKKNTIIFKTRKQLKQDEFIKKELKKSEDNRLNYIYFECFGKKGKDKNSIINNIKSIESNSNIYKNLYNILKLTSTTKK